VFVAAYDTLPLDEFAVVAKILRVIPKYQDCVTCLLSALVRDGKLLSVGLMSILLIDDDVVVEWSSSASAFWRWRWARLCVVRLFNMVQLHLKRRYTAELCNLLGPVRQNSLCDQVRQVLSVMALVHR
jgi:hypothetical protein